MRPIDDRLVFPKRVSVLLFVLAIVLCAPAYAQRSATAVTAGVAINNIANSSQGGYVDYSIAVPVGSVDLTINLSGGTGDADLYVRLNDFPTTATYDYTSLNYLTNVESVVIPFPAAGTYYITLYTARPYANATLFVQFQNPIVSRALNLTGTSDSTPGRFRYLWQKVPRTYRVKSTISEGIDALGDADLYFKYSTPPTTGSFDCKHAIARSNETCTPGSNPNGLNGFIGVRTVTAYTGVDVSSDSASELTVNSQVMTHFQHGFPIGARNVQFKLTGAGTGDCDLYTGQGFRPTTSTYTSADLSSGNIDITSWSSYFAGTGYVGLYGYPPTGCTSTGLQVHYDIIRTDLNADVRSDVVLQNSNTGEIAAWLMNGPTITVGQAIAVTSPQWRVEAHGDVNRDWKSDLFLRYPDGSVAVWLMNGTQIYGGYVIGQGAGYNLRGVGDFNGDGNSDVALMNPGTGEVALWFLNGLTPPSITTGAVIAQVPTSWAIAGVGDLDGDGKSDLVLFNSSSNTVAVWLMNGTTIKTGAVVGVVSNGWSVVAVADIDGNAADDVILQHTGGDVAVWQMEGYTIRVGAMIGNAGSFQVKAAADFNGDRRADVLLQDGSNQVAMWLLDGATIKVGQLIGSVPSGYRIALQP